jgi:hypothetical protein
MTMPRLLAIGLCLLIAVYTTVTSLIFRHRDSTIVGLFAEDRAPSQLPIDPNRLLLAASFGASLNPKDIEIIPYYKRSKKTPILRDISICTLVSPERREMLEGLASVHDGMSGWRSSTRRHGSSHLHAERSSTDCRTHLGNIPPPYTRSPLDDRRNVVSAPNDVSERRHTRLHHTPFTRVQHPSKYRQTVRSNGLHAAARY